MSNVYEVLLAQRNHSQSIKEREKKQEATYTTHPELKLLLLWVGGRVGGLFIMHFV